MTIDDKLSFDKHMSEKINKANSVMGLIRRTMEYMDNDLFKTLFTALVRPHLEYANQVWCPHLVKHVDAIKMYNVELQDSCLEWPSSTTAKDYKN